MLLVAARCCCCWQGRAGRNQQLVEAFTATCFVRSYLVLSFNSRQRYSFVRLVSRARRFDERQADRFITDKLASPTSQQYYAD